MYVKCRSDLIVAVLNTAFWGIKEFFRIAKKILVLSSANVLQLHILLLLFCNKYKKIRAVCTNVDPNLIAYQQNFRVYAKW